MRETAVAAFQEAFGRHPDFTSRAPGRIEFIGNHTDYNGGIVLGASIDRDVTVAIGKRKDGIRSFVSDYAGGSSKVEFPADAKLEPQSGAASWVNYPLGVLHALKHFELQIPEGFDFLAVSNLPSGSGLSSSAAIELASALAFLALTGQSPARETVVKAARYAENHFVGVPCGILDQGVSGFGREGHLVFIDCKAVRFDTVPLPGDVHFWVFNTHTKHALVDGLYAARHRECMEAASALGVSELVDATPEMLAATDGKMSEAVRHRAQHVIEEIARVRQTVADLGKQDLVAVGRLLTASHRSSQHLFENSTPELDFLVDTLETAPSVYGARLTGGGFGGAAMAMTNSLFTRKMARDVAEKYFAEFGTRPDILDMRTGNGAEVLQP